MCIFGKMLNHPILVYTCQLYHPRRCTVNGMNNEHWLNVKIKDGDSMANTYWQLKANKTHRDYEFLPLDIQCSH
jgi:hypothetical protein